MDNNDIEDNNNNSNTTNRNSNSKNHWVDKNVNCKI